MKKVYNEPIVEFIMFNAEDIITTSYGNTTVAFDADGNPVENFEDLG